MAKSADAFRTISEVADWLGVPTHVLRFWESKFPQVKPVKRAGGRRYYRPNDMLLLAGIRVLLHDDGMTIRGVQKILREKGVKHVVSMADRDVVGGVPDTAEAPVQQPVPDEDTIVELPRKEESDSASAGAPVMPTPAAAPPSSPAEPEEPAEYSAEPGPLAADVDDDQMPLFSEEPSADEEPSEDTAPDKEPDTAPPVVEPVDDGMSDADDGSRAEPAQARPDLPGPSPVGGPSLAPLLDQIDTASPEVAREMRRVLAGHRDELEALRDRLREAPDTSGSDTDT